MFGLLLPTLIAIVAALGLGGSAAHLARAHFRWWPIVIFAFGVELILYNPPLNTLDWAMSVGPWIWVATKIGMLAALLRNARFDRRWELPFLVMAFGIGLNTLAIVTNAGHMPQSAEAAAAVWGSQPSSADMQVARLDNISLMGPDTRLPWLGDVLPEPRWVPRPNVLSVGDFLLAIGMAGWVFTAVRRPVVSSDEPAASCPDRDLSSSPDVELGENMLHVRFDRLDRHDQPLSDLAV
jgi:hypothetical protein